MFDLPPTVVAKLVGGLLLCAYFIYQGYRVNKIMRERRTTTTTATSPKYSRKK